MYDFRTHIKQHFHNLSKGQQKLAKYLLEDPQAFALNSAGEIGKKVGVSETTVIRFCYALQLSGFSELQKRIRENLLSQSGLDKYYSEKVKLAKQPHFYAQVMKQDIDNINRTIQHINENEFNRAIERLMMSDEIVITGLRTSYAAAHWFSFMLGMVRGNTYLYRPDTDDFIRQMSQMTKNTTVVAISFHRYIKETIKFVEIAKKHGAYIIGITDSPIAPISKYVDNIISIYHSESTIDATPALFSVLNALVAGVSVQDHEKFNKRKEQYDLIEDDHLFVNEGGEDK
ncbi:MurR/RpiR family transcriptional regulator [Fictibacillus barbaricus]|uniref:MurR/RpiR family transcriptional regulator n=1 Tax=Fictibacillus barbaricus TaxID=182136 RepID=A0ABS2Z934_9BACL|nr:MurR/RpiR family transcriptional regulator [Fictibacillus barbaricus]MBN3544201.1 MurR/RpiR family transcriptional regulator [Fictibacillus barbaricus]GGB69746.1 RpiR family transcriptional regulator [Fictibacillus barbaricus]